jgi:hypothetical protein
MVGKASGNTHSLELLDVDMGGSSQVGVSFGGFGVQAGGSTQGQWGTKNLSASETSLTRTSDQSQEMREGYSHTTQLSQMYHLLDSYHLGTNRAVFFMQGRPHVLESPTVFVEGPRAIDGVQEFFLVVNHPKGQDFCTSARLDTGHYTIVDIMDYDRKSSSNTVDIDFRLNPPTSSTDGNVVNSYFKYPGGAETLLFGCEPIDFLSGIYYDTISKSHTETIDYIPESGYKIDVSNNGGYEVITPGGNVQAHPNGNWIKLSVTASSQVDIENFRVCLCNPYGNRINESFGIGKASIRPYLISKEKTKKIGTKEIAIITTRGLCCCDEEAKKEDGIMNGTVIDIKDLIFDRDKYKGKPEYKIYNELSKMVRNVLQQGTNTLNKAKTNRLKNHAAIQKFINMKISGRMSSEVKPWNNMTPEKQQILMDSIHNNLVGDNKKEAFKAITTALPTLDFQEFSLLVSNLAQLDKKVHTMKGALLCEALKIPRKGSGKKSKDNKQEEERSSKMAKKK